MLFRRIVEVAARDEKHVDSTNLGEDWTEKTLEDLRQPNSNIQKGKREINPDEEMTWYRKVRIRSYIDEAYDGATRDWAIVDVPLSTSRVKLDGVGGASREIMGRYNSLRRGKFIAEDDAVKDRMWTKLTKGLVVNEAIQRRGYEFEETEYFYYVFEYLRSVSTISHHSCLSFRLLTIAPGGCAGARRDVRRNPPP
jgi:hypothetical protein